MKICKKKVKEVELNKLFISMKALIALQNIHTKFEQNPWWTVTQDSGRKRIPIVCWTEGPNDQIFLP